MFHSFYLLDGRPVLLNFRRLEFHMWVFSLILYLMKHFFVRSFFRLFLGF
ncbi:hypothetical protein RhiirC2_854218 [Rhizophagus irregularis]|uniref:Uncharacterized protein n=1 Tax=Rhizophagus irregularis TaxID=588596 RepID=A0A2N1MSD2_9GLOM|nr:hypothetical protein RhiirC2_854218 [Rhizophagus irregularis]